ncbi:MAG TPA: hypothetical protein VNF46_02825 [Gammaproteobacteria bacterium]|nr:hypothetical protein [Gammaproteobacteria bacterium]
MSFMGTGPQTSSMTVLKLLILIPIVLLFVGIGYVATLLAAIGNVFFIRLAVPELRMPEAHPMLMQFYSDLRWVNFLWGGMAKNKRLIRMCQRLTAWTIPLVYGRAAPANLP